MCYTFYVGRDHYFKIKTLTPIENVLFRLRVFVVFDKLQPDLGHTGTNPLIHIDFPSFTEGDSRIRGEFLL